MRCDQYNLQPLERRIDRKGNHIGIAEHFPEGPVRMSIETDLALIDLLADQIIKLEEYILKTAKVDDKQTLYLLQSIDGVGEILSMTMLYEIHDIDRFPRVQDFLSYCRLAPGQHISAGKKPAPAAQRWVTHISNGPSLRPPLFSSAQMTRSRSCCTGIPRNTENQAR